MRWLCSPMLCLAVGISLIGCSKSQPAAVQAESFDPDAVVRELMNRCDSNGDGSLEASELDSCLALKFSIPFFDKNKDRKIDRDELMNRILLYKGAVIPLGCQVTVGGVPAKGCTIIFTPDPAFSKFKPATGVTDESGFAKIKVEGKEGFGVPAGLYDVKITDETGKQIHRNPQGREVYDDGRDNRDLIQFSF